MARKFIRTKVIKGRRGKKRLHTAVVKGLRLIHIGDDVWKVGRKNWVPGKGKHQVIYGPNDAEYHVWGKDIDLLERPIYSEEENHYFSYSRNGNTASPAAAKVYILTSILDERRNWCFDLKALPDNGTVKIIYDNGTVKNIDFKGTFEPFENPQTNTFTGKPRGERETYTFKRTIYPIAYRLK